MHWLFYIGVWTILSAGPGTFVDSSTPYWYVFLFTCPFTLLFSHVAISNHYSFAGLGPGAGADSGDLSGDRRLFPDLSTIESEQSLEEGSLVGARPARDSERSIH